MKERAYWGFTVPEGQGSWWQTHWLGLEAEHSQLKLQAGNRECALEMSSDF